MSIKFHIQDVESQIVTSELTGKELQNAIKTHNASEQLKSAKIGTVENSKVVNPSVLGQYLIDMFTALQIGIGKPSKKGNKTKDGVQEEIEVIQSWKDKTKNNGENTPKR